MSSDTPHHGAELLRSRRFLRHAYATALERSHLAAHAARVARLEPRAAEDRAREG